MQDIFLITTQTELSKQAEEIATQWGFSYIDVLPSAATLYLELSPVGLSLKSLTEPNLNGVIVDFVTGAAAHRRKFGGGKGQSIAKAIGLNKGVTPSVLDGTAGLGRDAFVLAALGCQVTLVERHPVVTALLEDGLKRAYADPEIGPWMQERMILQHWNSLDILQGQISPPDVVYLDPMYPEKKKSALVKKEMRLFHELVGSDSDADGLLMIAKTLATKRIVVKRPSYAEPLDGQDPTLTFPMKKNRFDVYVLAGFHTQD
ncbi:class I SAM-dependent methyltransferase [Algicola sagamiensis]|uniref:class I SAM-dependent methyltransferase n=1 Tax=Algicola sagamiensis TaxID=163869 RepID=UPI00037F5EFD|nr:class I SAM-dependent methyltransferase [Algicola sagamiensis]